MKLSEEHWQVLLSAKPNIAAASPLRREVRQLHEAGLIKAIDGDDDFGVLYFSVTPAGLAAIRSRQPPGGGMNRLANQRAG